ncbi:hypothetical protein ACIO8G_24120 [Streptomyces sp. NPDC087219]|uniref:hypothetical protein n=1 Tax=Streptomyces sp. NPDC087219 TaxID=3365770 RepID=UPI0037F3EE02
MGGELVLASKWDDAFDVARFLYVGFFSDLPAWARYTVLALVGSGLVHGLVSWLRKRSAHAPEAERTAPAGGETVQADETRVR